MALKLVAKLEKDDTDRVLENSTTSGYERWVFYLNDVDVTPREIISTKYPLEVKCESTLCRERTFSSTLSVNMDDENFIPENFFLSINAKTVDYLLDAIRGDSTQNQNELRKYDVGLDIPFPRENIMTKGYEIELTESPTFSILDLPGGITVKGDGDYDNVQKMKEIYQDNCVKSEFIKTDNVSQTINYFTEREDQECQTRMSTTNTIGTQVHDYNIIDEYNNGTINSEPNGVNDMESRAIVLSEHSGNPQARRNSKKMITTDAKSFYDKTMVIERILAQNALNAERQDEMSSDTERISSKKAKVIYAYCFTLTLNVKGYKGLTVRCTHWNKTETHLLAVGYSKLIYNDYEDKPNAVAVWSTKNVHTPERFYEFGKSDITCLKFSMKNPNRLAIGFLNGELLIIDISSKDLKIVFQKSKQLSTDNSGIMGLFWTEQFGNDLFRIKKYECLITCSFNGRVARYRYNQETLEETVIMRLFHSDGLTIPEGPQNVLNSKSNSTFVRCATKIIGLNQNQYLVGTLDGLVYACSYENSMKYSIKLTAHFGIIKSLEKSPYSDDVYLSTGCDCSIKIWVGDIFIAPVITLHTERQIEKATWSRTNSTIIAAIVENCLHVWDLFISTDAPIFVHEMEHPNHKYSGLEFTLDGKNLCVFDTNGNIIMYTWTDIIPSTDRVQDDLMYSIAKCLYGEQFLCRTLCKIRPEYKNIFTKLYEDKQKSYFY